MPNVSKSFKCLSATTLDDFKRKAWAGESKDKQLVIIDKAHHVQQSCTRAKHKDNAKLITLQSDISARTQRVLLAGAADVEEVFHTDTPHANDINDHEQVKQCGDIEVPVTAARHNWHEMLKPPSSDNIMITSGGNTNRPSQKELQQRTLTSNKEAMRAFRESMSMQKLEAKLRRPGSAFSVICFNSGGLGCTRAAVHAGFKPIYGTEIDTDMINLFEVFSGRPSKGDTFKAIINQEDQGVFAMTSSQCIDFAMSTPDAQGVDGVDGIK